MSGRRGTSSENAVHALIEVIYGTWSNKGMATLLLLDVIGTFDNVHKKDSFIISLDCQIPERLPYYLRLVDHIRNDW